MPPVYDVHTLKIAILFNTQEVLPNDPAQLDQELVLLVNAANSSGEPIRHYIGFEISGQIHIGTGIASALKIKKLQAAGVKCSLYLADYHTFLNNKLDGQLETIRRVAREYFGPVMLQCCAVVGCNVDEIELLYAEELYSTKRRGQSYWDFDMRVGKELTLNRVLKSISVMGKVAGDGVIFGTLRYPVMQVADAFFMQTHLVQAGLDQRKCHVLMRETAPKLAGDFALKLGNQTVKPIAIHHSLLLGLEKPQFEAADLDSNQEVKNQVQEVAKMSKSKPDSALWVHDNYDEIYRKLKNAYCPMPRPAEQTMDQITAEQDWNPLLNWCRNMIFPAGQTIQIERQEQWGGNIEYTTYEQLETDYFTGKLHPMDLKTGVAKTLTNWFTPIRTWVETNPTGLEFLKAVKK